MAIDVDALPVSDLVRLVNGWGTVPRAEAGEATLSFPPGDELARSMGLPESASPSDRELTAVADRLYPVFAADRPEERAAAVTTLLTETGVRPAVRADGPRVRAGWTTESRADIVLAAAAIALYGHLDRHQAGRLGTCTGARCADVYVDASPGAHRRFCSTTCQNRARVAAFRRRKKAARP